MRPSTLKWELCPISAESDPGFILQVSPMKKAKKGSQYFHCSLQTSPTKTFRVVEFDQSTHIQCQHYEKIGNPVKLLNVKEDNGQYLINQTTTLLQMSNSDVTFTSTPSSSSSDSDTQSSPAVAFNITLNQLPTLTRNQKVNMTGRYSNSWAKRTQRSEKKKWAKWKGERGLRYRGYDRFCDHPLLG